MIALGGSVHARLPFESSYHTSPSSLTRVHVIDGAAASIVAVSRKTEKRGTTPIEAALTRTAPGGSTHDESSVATDSNQVSPFSVTEIHCAAVVTSDGDAAVGTDAAGTENLRTEVVDVDTITVSVCCMRSGDVVHDNFSALSRSLASALATTAAVRRVATTTLSRALE